MESRHSTRAFRLGIFQVKGETLFHWGESDWLFDRIKIIFYSRKRQVARGFNER